MITVHLYNASNNDTQSVSFPSIHLANQWLSENTGWIKTSNTRKYPTDILNGDTWEESQRTSDQKKVAQENMWVQSEMPYIQIQLDYHSDNNPRAKSTEAKWRAYRVQLCDYVKDGKITANERPYRPV